MEMWQYHPLLVVFHVGGLVSLAVAIYSWRHVRKHGTSYLVVSVGLLAFHNAIWVFAASMKVASPDLSTKLLFYKLEYLGSAVNPSVAVVLALAYVGRDRWLTRRTFVALAIVPAVVIPLIIVNPGDVMIAAPKLVPVGDVVALEHEFPPLFSLYLAWALGAAFLASLLVGYGGLVGSVPRKPALLIALTLLLPVVVVSLKAAGVYPPNGEGINVTPAVNAVSLFLLAFAITRYRLLELRPVGRERAIDVLQDGYVLLDTTDRIVDANPAAKRLLGESRTETLVGRSISAFVPSGAEPDVGDDDITFQKDGRTVRGLASSISGPNGTLGRVLMLRDVTRRTERQRELETQNERLQAIFENTNSAIVEYVVVDGEPIVEAVNDRFETVFGYDADAVVGNSLDEFIIPPDRTAEAASLNEQVERRERLDAEIIRQTADGLRTFLLRNAPIERDDEIRGYAIYTDITARKERERELERKERIIENVPVGVYRSTPGTDGEIVFANEALVEILGASSKAELSEHPVSDFYADDVDRATLSEQARESETITNEELRLETLDDEQLWVSVSNRSVEIDGEVYFEGAVQDVTERKQYERRLEDQMEQLEVLNRIVRHDINNDMSVVIGMIEAIQMRATDTETAERLDSVLNAARHAVELTGIARDLMESMLSEGRELTSIQLARILRQEVDHVRKSYDDAVVQYGGDLVGVQVLADDLLGSVFRNLLKNAIDHNDEEEPEVTISVSERTDSVRISVADNGPGIPPDRQDAVFGKDEKGLESEGTGIGLYLVRTLVESYGGDVWIETNDPKGTVVVVELEKAERQ